MTRSPAARRRGAPGTDVARMAAVRPAAAGIVVALALVAPGTARAQAAQTATEIFLRAFDDYEQRAAEISGYTVTQETLGYRVTLEFAKEILEGHPIFVLTSTQGREISRWGHFYGAYLLLAERARLDGTEAVDGRDVHVLRVDDFAGLDLSEEIGAGLQGDFTPERGWFSIDASSYLLRRVVMNGTLAGGEAASPFTFELALRDWREVDGWLHPFELVVTAEGMPPGMTAADLEKLLLRLRRMREEIAATPEEQRDALERLIGSRIQELERMIETGVYEVRVRTVDLVVNPPPSGSPE